MRHWIQVGDITSTRVRCLRHTTLCLRLHVGYWVGSKLFTLSVYVSGCLFFGGGLVVVWRVEVTVVIVTVTECDCGGHRGEAGGTEGISRSVIPGEPRYTYLIASRLDTSLHGGTVVEGA